MLGEGAADNGTDFGPTRIQSLVKVDMPWLWFVKIPVGLLKRRRHVRYMYECVCSQRETTIAYYVNIFPFAAGEGLDYCTTELVDAIN